MKKYSVQEEHHSDISSCRILVLPQDSEHWIFDLKPVLVNSKFVYLGTKQHVEGFLLLKVRIFLHEEIQKNPGGDLKQVDLWSRIVAVVSSLEAVKQA